MIRSHQVEEVLPVFELWDDLECLGHLAAAVHGHHLANLKITKKEEKKMIEKAVSNVLPR